MAQASSQKFIARNRAPRVQIEYDVELYGAEKKIQLPFVMGVMADLSGKPADPLAPVVDREFLEIDVDNFNDRLKAMKPRVAFQVPNVLTGQGNLSIDITFESMDDFSPGAVASKVDGLNQLLKSRTQLSNLLTYMDGKGGAEELIAKALNDSALLQSLAAAPKPADETTKPSAEADKTDGSGDSDKTEENQ
jgi:type VI secretion system protein ImpB